jgi:Peptidase family M1 domain
MNFSQLHRSVVQLCVLAAICLAAATARAQDNPSVKSKEFYDQIKAFSLSGGSVQVKDLPLKRDRADMMFTGTFYFSAPVDGHVTGAVFVGDGKFNAPAPANEFERDNLKRMIGTTDGVDSDFRTAVLRFSDDTFERIAQKPTPGSADAQTQKLASELDPRILRETGANLAARVALSLLNQEKPGFFFAQFDGGRRGRFNLLLDHQNRLPVANFDINGGEKGLLFKYRAEDYDNDIWMAFYSLADYQRGNVDYSDVNDQIDITHYDLNLNLSDYKKAILLRARIQAGTRAANLRAVSFVVGENLGEYESWRLKKQMRLKQARLGSADIAFAQEDWEGGFTVFLPGDVPAGQNLEFMLQLEGDFMYDAETSFNCDCHYPRSNETWFPRHGYLDRATFDITYRHPKKFHMASGGLRLSEEVDPEDKNLTMTKYQMAQPVPALTFALAPYERKAQTVNFKEGGVGDPIPIEFSSLPGSRMAIKEDFILAELDNSLRYFTLLFGKYPYPTFGAAFHPFGFGQGFPTLMMIPAADNDSKYTYVFIAHETSHQWWGDMVSWRSYRDQWLSEGFAEYSGILYTGRRDSPGARDQLISNLRESLRLPPETQTGVGKGRLVDVGPIILGHRLSTRKTLGAYQTLIYNKGALVLRMLHFLLSDPTTGKGDPFFAMMTDFVKKYQNQAASTDDFRLVANEHFARSAIGQKYHLNSLDWFFRQWVYRTELPSYQMEYQVQEQPDGKFLLTGTVKQEDVPADWLMILPVVISFGGKQAGTTTVHALGPSTNFQIRLPARPTKVELDPDHWVLSAKTSTKGN